MNEESKEKLEEMRKRLAAKSTNDMLEWARAERQYPMRPVVIENHALIETIRAAWEIITMRDDGKMDGLRRAAIDFLEEHFRSFAQESKEFAERKDAVRKLSPRICPKCNYWGGSATCPKCNCDTLPS